ncbi:MAG: hypothetical protein WC346_01090 [Methanogenium sp.]|jgi:hypothetical protein
MFINNSIANEVEKFVLSKELQIPSKPNKKIENIFDLIENLTGISDKELGNIHAIFTGWFCYFLEILGAATVNKIEAETNYQVAFNKRYVESTSKTIKDKSIITNNYTEIAELFVLLQSAKAKVEYLTSLKDSYEYGVKAVSREISRRQLKKWEE